MKNIIMLLFLLGFPILAQTVVAPPEAELDKYPILNGALSQQQIKELGLEQKILLNPWTGYNWSRKIKKFLFETLPMGTKVLSDTRGIPRYKRDCWNRLVQVSGKEEAHDYCKNYPSYFVFADNSTTNNYYDLSSTTIINSNGGLEENPSGTPPTSWTFGKTILVSLAAVGGALGGGYGCQTIEIIPGISFRSGDGPWYFGPDMKKYHFNVTTAIIGGVALGTIVYLLIK